MYPDQQRPIRWLALGFAIALGLAIAIYRVVPYYFFDPLNPTLWNLAPIGALALFVGSRLRTAEAWLVPLGAMLLSDLLLIYPLSQLGWQSISWGTPLIYASFAIYVGIGRLIQQRDLSPMVIGGAALLASLQFFVLTNFGSWLAFDSFPKTLMGLRDCYLSAIPFYRNTLATDLAFSALFFASFAAIQWMAERSAQPLPAEQAR